jgi:ABC-type dipeptide/oligopeptide/nickel transport system ATPase subunit
MKLLTVKNLFYSINKPEIEILSGISFEMEKGISLGMAGESGAGKTTLARIIAGHLIASKGEVKLNLQNNNGLNPVQLLFQNTRDIINPFRRVLDVITEAAALIIKNQTESVNEAERILEMLDLNSSLWYNRGYELSGGQQQRVALARLLAVHPALLILDEPFAAQDIDSQLNLLNMLIGIKKEFDLSVICISHNLKILRKFADEIIIMKDGNIIEKGETSQIFFSPAHAYTKLLLKAEEYKLSAEDFKQIRY